MKRMPFAVAVAAVTVILAACTQPADGAASADNDPAAVTQVRDAWAAAWRAGNAEQLAALYSDDAADIVNHMPTASGPSAIQAMYVNQFAQVTPTDVLLTPEKTEVFGDIAYERGTFSFSMTPKAGGAAIVENGRYLVVLKKQADGTWKLTEVMGNSADPLPGMPGATTTTTQ